MWKKNAKMNRLLLGKFQQKETRQRHMGDWIHKKRTYIEPQCYSPHEEKKLGVWDGDILETFVQWLDYQCEGGWELCHIEIIDLKPDTWLGYKTGKECIFRKKNDR